MNLYAESSAVLAWLLDEEAGAAVRGLLGEVLGDLRDADAADRRAHLTTAAAHWNVLRIGGEIVDRARQPFPNALIRTLDALHLASALTARTAVAGLVLLSLDDRIRDAGQRLGFPLLPETT